MKKNLLKYFACGLVALTTVALTACSDDEKYDVVGNPNNLIYFNMTDINNPKTFSIAKTPIGNFGGFEVEYPVFCTRFMARETSIKAVVDNSFVEAYNEEHETSYAAVPEGVVDMSLAVAHFHEGEIASYDSLKVVVKDADLSPLSEEAYLVPIKLSQVTGDGKGSEERGVIYIVLTLTEQIVNERAQIEDLRGVQISLDVMKTWTADGGLDVGKLADETRSTSSSWARGTHVIDMQRSYPVSGLKLLSRYANGTFSQGVKLEMSEDGENFKEIGTLFTMPRDEEDFQYFILYGGVSARYLRLTYGSTTLSELRVYADPPLAQ